MRSTECAAMKKKLIEDDLQEPLSKQRDTDTKRVQPVS
jgi:hypothetical protein